MIKENVSIAAKIPAEFGTLHKHIKWCNNILMERQRQSSQISKDDLRRLIQKIETGDYPAVKTAMTVTDAARTTAEVAKINIDQAEDALGSRR